MKRLVLGGLSLLLVVATTTPAFAASRVQVATTVNNASLLTLSNPPAEVPSPSLQYLDPSSAVQALAPKATMAVTLPAEVPSPSLQGLDRSSAMQAVTPLSRLTSFNPPAELSSSAVSPWLIRVTETRGSQVAVVQPTNISTAAVSPQRIPTVSPWLALVNQTRGSLHATFPTAGHAAKLTANSTTSDRIAMFDQNDGR